MHANHLPLVRDTDDDGLQPAVNEQVNPPIDQEQAQRSLMSGMLRSLRARIGQFLQRGARSPEYTLLLPDGHVLVLRCVKLPQLLSGCIWNDQEKEAVCAR